MPPLLLRSKLIVAFLAVTMITLVMSAVLNLRMAYDGLIGTAKTALRGAAVQTADAVDSFMLDNLNTIRTQSLDPTIIEYLETSPDIRRGSALEARVIRVLNSFQRRDHVNISSYAVFGRRGERLLDTHPSSDMDVFEKALFDESVKTGLPVLSPLVLSKASGMPSLCFSSPVRDARGNIIGSIRIRYNANAVQKLVFEKEGLLGPGSVAVIVDKDAVRVADSHDRNMIYKPPRDLSRDRAQQRSAEGKYSLTPGKGETLPELYDGLREDPGQPFFTARLYPGSDEDMLCAVVPMKSRPWRVIFAQPYSRFLSTWRNQVLLTVLLFFCVGGIAMVAAFFLARNIARPVGELTALARRVAHGDLEQRITSNSEDEIGELGRSFNRMTENLQASRRDLMAYTGRLETLYDAIPDAVFVHDPDGRIVDANRKGVEIFGYTREDILSLSISDLSREEYTQDMALGRVIRAYEQGYDDFEWVGKRKDGSEFPMQVRLRKLSLGGRENVIAVVTDISERKDLERQLLHAQKMEAVGTLAGGIAHDFNNLLSVILGYTSLMLMDSGSDDPHYEYLKMIEERVESGVGLTRQLLGFARGGKYEVKVLDLNDLVRRTAATFGRTRKEVSIHEDLDAELRAVEADPSQMEQMLVNLYLNAWQAMPGGGDMRLASRNVVLDADSADAYGVPEGRYVELAIADSGLGMDEETRLRIFEPFFTTREMGHGTGLGLASVYGIVKNHGGHIKVYSEKGEGTAFHIYLPATDKGLERVFSPSMEVKRGSECILLVDDEPMVLQASRRMLESLGYRVYALPGGAEALELYREKWREIDLVILDMIMPGMSGGETFDALKAVNPDVLAVLASGYSLNEAARQILEQGCRGFLQKPFDVSGLSRKLRSLLD